MQGGKMKNFDMQGGKMKNFDPIRDVPLNDEQAKIALERPPDDFLTATLQNLYEVYRAQGYNVLDAFGATLRAHLEAFEKREAANE
jgi:hypothetical protein